MSALVTLGFGVQSGLVTTWGWGGHATLPAPVGIPQTPVVTAEELVPELIADGDELIPDLRLSGELVPQYYDIDDIERIPEVTEVEELKPRIKADDDDLVPKLSPDRLRPRMVKAEANIQPQIIEDEKLEPEVAEAEIEPAFKGPSLRSKEIKPGK